MPSQLINNSDVSFVCAKSFTYNGEKFEIGQDFPQEKSNNIEVMVRNRFLVPVVDDMTTKPRHWYREIRQRDIVLNKLGVGSSLANKESRVPDVREVPVDEHDEPSDVTEEAEEDNFQVSEHTVPQVLEFVQAHPDELENVIAAEENGKQRSTLLDELKSLREDEGDE